MFINTGNLILKIIPICIFWERHLHYLFWLQKNVATSVNKKWRKRTKKKEGGVWKHDNIKCIYHTTDGKIQMKQWAMAIWDREKKNLCCVNSLFIVPLQGLPLFSVHFFVCDIQNKLVEAQRTDECNIKIIILWK